jgi:hypothetical protein
LRKAANELKAQNTVVLSGFKQKDSDSKTTGEIDFLIISLPLQSIIQIEVKRGSTDASRSSAAKQLIRGQAFFEDSFPFSSSENWNYTKMMCFGEVVEEDICDDCKPFVLSANFIESNLTQPIAVQISDQFKTFWKCRKVNKGKINFLQMKFSFYSYCKNVFLVSALIFFTIRRFDIFR